RRLSEMDSRSGEKPSTITWAPASLSGSSSDQSPAIAAAPTPASKADAGPPAAQEPASATAPARPEPFAFADFTWLTGNSRQKEFPLAGKVLSGEFRVDAAYTYSFNHPKDNTIVGSTEVFR